MDLALSATWLVPLALIGAVVIGFLHLAFNALQDHQRLLTLHGRVRQLRSEYRRKMRAQAHSNGLEVPPEDPSEVIEVSEAPALPEQPATNSAHPHRSAA
ncbi:MAG: hypothetical protein C0513_02485 [Isosphaera sp.]|nr:hypothetical protein [Isosphaera sp.]